MSSSDFCACGYCRLYGIVGFLPLELRHLNSVGDDRCYLYPPFLNAGVVIIYPNCHPQQRMGADLKRLHNAPGCRNDVDGRYGGEVWCKDQAFLQSVVTIRLLNRAHNTSNAIGMGMNE
jgi:hypothetical protein